MMIPAKLAAATQHVRGQTRSTLVRKGKGWGSIIFDSGFIGTDSNLAGVQDVLLYLIDASYSIEMP
jgi:hypothetical protein